MVLQLIKLRNIKLEKRSSLQKKSSQKINQHPGFEDANCKSEKTEFKLQKKKSEVKSNKFRIK